VPIEAKMVTKAIERAQNTVEQRNAEIRKNVLKYDEVMNEQRKVIYKRRDQILDGADLRDEPSSTWPRRSTRRRPPSAPATSPTKWDLEGLLTEITTYWPTELTGSSSARPTTPTSCTSGCWPRHPATTRARAELGRSHARVERQVMLRIIDQRWREHLLEMDYLQEGINLRAMGQKDPLTEWQREGFEMFGQMMMRASPRTS
jgi:preprotein translocase subunit SecA